MFSDFWKALCGVTHDLWQIIRYYPYGDAETYKRLRARTADEKVRERVARHNERLRSSFTGMVDDMIEESNTTPGVERSTVDFVQGGVVASGRNGMVRARRVEPDSLEGMAMTNEELTEHNRSAVGLTNDEITNRAMAVMDRAVANLSDRLDEDLRQLLQGSRDVEGNPLTLETLTSLYGARVPPNGEGGVRLSNNERALLVTTAAREARENGVTGEELERYMLSAVQHVGRLRRQGTETGRVQTATVNQSNKPKAKKEPVHVLAAGRVQSLQRWKHNRDK